MLITEEGVQRLQRALDHITLHPEEWDQSSWLRFIDANEEHVTGWDEVQAGGCGTICCLAGRLVLNEGVTWSQSSYVGYSGTHYVAEDEVVYNGYRRRIPSLAEELLTGEVSEDSPISMLFSGDNNLQDLWTMAQVLTGYRLRVPIEFREDSSANA